MSVAELYRIAIGDRVWTITSADANQTHNSELYIATAMGRGGYQVRGEVSKANLEVRLPLDHELAVLLLGSWLEEIATLTLFRKRASGTSTIWKGRLTGTTPGDDVVKLVFESIFTSMRRPGLRARFQKSCRHALYGRGCNLDPEAFAAAATLDAIDGRTLTVPEAALQASGYYAGGMVRAPDGTLTYISAHNGDQLEMNRISGALASPLAADGPGVAITIYPGCDHSYATCDAKFSNDDNYGGFDYIPTKNPMGGSSIV